MTIFTPSNRLNHVRYLLGNPIVSQRYQDLVLRCDLRDFVVRELHAGGYGLRQSARV